MFGDRDFIHCNPITEIEEELAKECLESEREIKRLRAELESTIRREEQERANGFSWMDKCKLAESRVKCLEGVILDAKAYAGNPSATSWAGLLDILDDAFPETEGA